MTDERIAHLEALCQQAEKEPWHTDSSPYNETSPFMVRTANGWVVAEGITHVMDAEFIAYARTALPEALAEVRHLRQCLEVLADATKLGAEHHNSHLWAYIMGEALQEDPRELPTWEGENRQ